MKPLKWIVILVVLAAIGVGVRAWLKREDGPKQVKFRTVTVERGDLVQTISATGTVEPEEVVDIGAQIAGTIVKFGLDEAGKPVDYGSKVKKGALLAEIDDSIYSADARVAAAQLKAAEAGVTRAQADLEQSKAKLVQAASDWERAKKLGPSEALSQSAYDAYRAAYQVASSDVAVQQAALLQAKANVNQSQAALDRAQCNLGYCTIRSPVDGVIIARRVNIGQTVVASLNAPSLFLLAKDLKRMQVWVAVNEADIGRIQPGEPVHFTVDAFPDEKFEGQVEKIRLNAQMTQNVVTYTVEIRAENEKGRLLPYLTANVKFVTGEKKGVLIVPNAALRYHPSANLIAGESPSAPGGAKEGSAAKKPHGPVVWVRDGPKLRPVPVTKGLSNESETEVSGEGITAGTSVVLGEDGGAEGAGPSEVNPFTPNFHRARQGGHQ